MDRPKLAVVDGSNVAYVEKSKSGNPKVSNLIAVRRALEDRGYETVVIVDASLRHRVDDAEQLEALIAQQRVRQAPAGTDADFFVLKTAEAQEGFVVSNDQYEPFREAFPWIDTRRVPLMIIDGVVELYEPGLDVAGAA